MLDQIFYGSGLDMREVPSGSVRFVLASPPINDDQQVDFDQKHDRLLKATHQLLDEIWRVLVPGGRAAIIVPGQGSHPYFGWHHYVTIAAGEWDFVPRGEIVWKTNGPSVATHTEDSVRIPASRGGHKYIVVLVKPHVDGSLDRSPNLEHGDTLTGQEFLDGIPSIWEVPLPPDEEGGQTAALPTELARRLIELFTSEDDIILDPFMGVGTTAVAAIESRRHFVGYAESQDLVDIARKRAAVADSSPSSETEFSEKVAAV